MNTSTESTERIKMLEAELAAIKHKEVLDILNGRLDEFRKKYLGKCFSSHTIHKSYIAKLRRNASAVLVSLYRINDVRIGDQYNAIDLNNLPDYINIDNIGGFNFNAVMTADIVEISLMSEGSCDMSTKKNHPVNSTWDGGRMRYEIDPHMFENIWNMVNNGITDICLTSGNILGDPEIHVRGFRDYDKLTALKQAGLTTVKLNESEMHWTDWHPFVYTDEMLATKLSLELMENKRKEVAEKINRTRGFSCGGEHVSAYAMTEIDRRQRDAYDSVIDKLKKEMHNV